MNDQEMAALAAQAAAMALRRCAGGLGDAHAAFVEALRQVGKGPAGGKLKVRPAIVNLYATVTSTTSPQNSDFQIPAREVFLVKEARGVLAMNDFNGEAATLGNFNMSPQDWVVAKAYNTKIKMETLADGITQTLSLDAILATFLASVGGAPIRFDENGPGWVIRPAEKIRMTATLIDTGVSGGSSIYGVQLSGVMIETD